MTGSKGLMYWRDRAQGWLGLRLGAAVGWVLSFVISDDDLARWSGED